MNRPRLRLRAPTNGEATRKAWEDGHRAGFELGRKVGHGEGVLEHERHRLRLEHLRQRKEDK